VSKRTSIRFIIASILLTLFSPTPYNSANAAYGQIDNSFGGVGTGYNYLQPSATINGFAVENSKATSGVLDSLNRKVIAGYVSYDDGDGTAFLVARFTSDGLIDTSFGPNREGFNILNINGRESFESVKLQSDGKIVAAGHFKDSSSGLISLALVRFSENGIIDTTFGNSGTGIETTTSALSSSITTLLIDSSDQIIVVGI
jgi:uncharacterized delta-60 repeat protein